MKVLPNTLWGDFKKKNMFCKHVNKSAFLFSEEIQIYLRLIFCWETCLHSSFFDTKLEANFHQNLQCDTYQSDVHTSKSLL